MVSEGLGQIAKIVAHDVRGKKIVLPSFNPMFHELIRIKSGKANGARYHPIRAGHTAYEAMKGLLWSQRDNCYVGYLDFEDEKEELQPFIMQCEKELQEENTSNSPNLKDNNQDLATQMHQIIWHSATSNLECIGIHTYGSVCNDAKENRNHIKVLINMLFYDLI
ncbi:hypothetical protein RclHR1_04530004 [Rhizophagus clarus]|uniref:Uncharacterized protein n=1 Tax=Rhizophagus clarus TaxID=94130 RepID=A0A2Z6S0G7_9GLOM|nr:hypothetical protein RclHR1_04530004 [Rhizophagus clarus]